MPPSEETELQARAFQALHEMAVAAAGVLDPTALARLAVNHVRDLLGVDAASVFCWDADARVLRWLAHNDPHRSEDGPIICPGEGATGLAFERRAPVIVENYPAWEHALSWTPAHESATVAAVPLLVNDHAVGVLLARTYGPHHYEPEHIRLLSLLAAQVAPALEAARLYAESEQRRVQAEAQAERYQRLYQAVACGVLVRGPNGEILEANEAAQQSFGLTMDQLQGRTPESLFQATREDGSALPADERPGRVALRERRAIRGYTLSVLRPDGQRRWFQGNAIPAFGPDGQITHVVSSFIDITDRKQAEESLRASEERFRRTFEQAAVGIAHLTLDGRWLLVNPKFCDIVGYTNEELIGRPFQEITHPDDLPANMEREEQLAGDDNATYSLEKRYIHRDGRCVWVHLTLALARDAAGKPLYRIVIVEDIGERKQMVASLLQSADYFSKTFHDNTAAMCISRVVDGRFVDVNRSFSCLVGYHRDTVIGRTAAELQLWADSEDYSRVVHALQEHQALHNVELRFRTAAGAVRDGMVSRELIEFGGEQCILSTLYDITDRKRVEAAVQEAKRLEGRLEGIILAAREMGHLLNNDLQIPVSTLELLDSELELPPELRAFLDRAKADLLAATQHLSQLQRVVRVETKETPFGPSLDLERSTKPDEENQRLP